MHNRTEFVEEVKFEILKHIVGPGSKCACGLIFDVKDFDELARHVANKIADHLDSRMDHFVL